MGQDKAAANQAKTLRCWTENDDAIDFVNNQLSRENGPDWIVPAVPVHLAWEWCRLRADYLTPYPLPESLEFHLLNCMHGAGHDIYVSHDDYMSWVTDNDVTDVEADSNVVLLLMGKELEHCLYNFASWAKKHDMEMSFLELFLMSVHLVNII